MVGMIMPAFLLISCNSIDRRIPVKPDLAQVDSRLKQPCDNPVDLPNQWISGSVATPLWLEDRNRLRRCKRKHGAVVNAYEARDGAQGR